MAPVRYATPSQLDPAHSRWNGWRCMLRAVAGEEDGMEGGVQDGTKEGRKD